MHHGRAGDSLLDSYQSERRQIALVNSTQSVKNGKKIFSFLKTLGTAGMDDVEAARANLERSIHSPEKQEMIAAEIKGQREHFDNVRFCLLPPILFKTLINIVTAGDPHRLCVRR